MSEKQVYVAESEDSIKIGVSKNPKERVGQLNTGNPNDVTLKLVLDELDTTAKSAEQWESDLHDYLGEFKLNGEWFEEKAMGKLHELLASEKSEKELSKAQSHALEIALMLEENFPNDVVAESHMGPEFDWGKPGAREHILQMIVESYNLPHGVCDVCEHLAYYHRSEDAKTCQRCKATKQGEGQ